ncbi:MAG: ornithine carbamoyltransferase [Actinomycetota bacterium]|nr:ornithine carbamoyltransferase [Actinomycetota bacterium]
MTRRLLDVDDLSVEELETVLGVAAGRVPDPGRPLDGKGVALVFEKASNRTRNSCEMAVVALGGHPVTIQSAEVGIDSRESAEDVARSLGCFHSIVCARVMAHGTLERMAGALDHAGVPVVNLLSDRAHPCQAIADVATIRQLFGPDDPTAHPVAFVGDANNVWRSLALAAAMVGIPTRVASPPGFGPTDEDVARIVGLGGEVVVTDDPREAVAGAGVVYTDVWTSMGQESERSARLAAFAGYTVDEDLVALAASDAIVLYCLPAHRGEEITAGVLEGPRSAVWEQAANRMHAMRGVFTWLAYAGLREPLDDPVTGRSIPAPGPGGADHRGHR